MQSLEELRAQWEAEDARKKAIIEKLSIDYKPRYYEPPLKALPPPIDWIPPPKESPREYQKVYRYERDLTEWKQTDYDMYTWVFIVTAIIAGLFIYVSMHP